MRPPEDSVKDSGKYFFRNPDVQTVFEISREAMAGHFDVIQEKYRDIPIRSELLTVIGTMISSRELRAMGENKEVDNMCTAIERLKQENLEKGKIEGMEKGRIEGMEKGKILLVKNMLSMDFLQTKSKNMHRLLTGKSRRQESYPKLIS